MLQDLANRLEVALYRVVKRSFVGMVSRRFIRTRLEQFRDYLPAPTIDGDVERCHIVLALPLVEVEALRQAEQGSVL